MGVIIFAADEALHCSELPVEIKRSLGSFIQVLKISLDARWVPEENLHLTLQFLGDTPKNRSRLLFRG